MSLSSLHSFFRLQFWFCSISVIYIWPCTLIHMYLCIICLTTQVTHLKDIDTWIQSTFYPFISGNGPGFHDIAEKNMASDGTSFIIGLVRLRQIRKRRKTYIFYDVMNFVNILQLCLHVLAMPLVWRSRIFVYSRFINFVHILHVKVIILHYVAYFTFTSRE